MPPKSKKPAEPSKKADQKKKEKIIEDRTFGLKNKKGAKNQKFIQQVQNQVKFGNQSAKKAADVAKTTEKKKDEKKKELDELNNLFKPVTTQKIEKGADPKSVLCAFYKQGQCTKGDKCKFSHDLSLDRKSEKRNVYVDIRDNEEDSMGSWNEEKLKEVVEKKHGEGERKMSKMICKYFLDALENNKYGWFWECPNGLNKCHYRHALPPGFTLKKDKKKDEKKEEISIEDLVENQRAQLGNNLTQVTYETFLTWKKKKMKEKQLQFDKEEDRKKAEFKAGRNVGLSGRDMFTFNPELATCDEMEKGEDAVEIQREDDNEEEEEEEEEEEDDVPCNEISEESLMRPLENVVGGTIATTRHWERADPPLMAEGGAQEDDSKEADAVPIDENLFEDDLDDLEEELDMLDV